MTSANTNSTQTSNLDELRETIKNLEQMNMNLIKEKNALLNSRFAKQNISNIELKWELKRENILNNELSQKIDETEGTMFDIKNQAHHYAHLLGIDADKVRMAITEGIQNIIEHGSGPLATVRICLENDCANPNITLIFKHQLKPGEKYTLTDVNSNVQKGDISSDQFDFESSRGRGEFMMKEISDARKIINGTETLPNGEQVHYFVRKLIFYKDPDGPKERISLNEIKSEIDRMDYEDIICCFHIKHEDDLCHIITVACHKSKQSEVTRIMKEKGFDIEEFENYYRASFMSFKPKFPVSVKEIDDAFEKVYIKLHAELD